MLNLFKSAEAASTAILVAAICGLGLYCVHLKRELADEIDERQAMAAQAAMCRLNMEALAQESEQRAAEAAKVLEQAKVRARTLEQRADRILRQPAAVPGDDCASAKARARAWLEGRGQ